MKKHISILAMAWIVFAAFLTLAPAEDKVDVTIPRDIVDKKIQQVLGILKDETLKDAAKAEERRQKIRNALLEVVDMNIVGELTLATHRKKFNDQQFEKFKEAFSSLLFKTYISNLEKYTGENVQIQKAEALSSNKVRVNTTIKGKDREIPVEFSMLQKGAAWILYDVRVEGVSMVQNYREQFKEILGNESVDKFLERLKQKRAGE